MRGFKIKCTDKKWFFEFIPNNNNHQPIGMSSMFDNREACVAGLACLRNLIIENQINNASSEFVVVNKHDSKYSFSFVLNGMPLYHSRMYHQKKNCIKSIEMILRYVDAYTLNELMP